MDRVFTLCGVFFFAIVVAQFADAVNIMSGNDLYSACSQGAKLDTANRAEMTRNEVADAEANKDWCTAYIQGAQQTIALVRFDTSKVYASSCPENSVTNQQAQDVIIKYLRDHPENRHLPAPSLIALALHDAFPCISSKK